MRCTAALFILANALCAIAVSAQGASAPMSMTHSEAALPATADSDSLRDFATAASAGVERFRDRSAAIEAGYRRIGMDFPSMGEHWVNTSVLYQGGFDVAKPALLSYAVIDGRPVLTGAVYAMLLRAGELPPAVPGGRGKWHDHSGTLNDESSVPVHHGGMSDGSSTRLVVLHAWVGIPNPAGLFEADNWALPYVRAGVPIPNPISMDAARALSLVSGAKEYYIALAKAEGAKPNAVAPALDACASVVAPIAERMRGKEVGAPGDVAALEDAWRSALQRIARKVGPSVAARLNGGEAVLP